MRHLLSAMPRHRVPPPPRAGAAGRGPWPALLLGLLTPLAGCAVAPEAAATRVGLALLRAGPGPGCIHTGAAVHVGRQRFLTAAHLVDGTQPLPHGCARGGIPSWVRLAGRELPAELMRAGQADLEAGTGAFYVGGRDVALLRAAPLPPGTPALRLCPDPPRAGQTVEVVTPRRVARSEIAGIVRESSPLHGSYAELPLRLEPGESGGAVIDTRLSCLLGLVSHREEREGRTRTRIVPSPVLRAFIGE